MILAISVWAAFLSLSNNERDGRFSSYSSMKSSTSPNTELFSSSSEYLRNHETIVSNKDMHSIEIIANEGRTASFMLYWPSITTFTLVDGWKNDTFSELQSAVKEVVDMNPILTGRVTKSGWPQNKITVRTGAYPSESHEFVTNIDVSSENQNIPNIRALDETQLLRFMDDFIAPRVSKSHSVLELIQNGNPLFGLSTKIILIEDNILFL